MGRFDLYFTSSQSTLSTLSFFGKSKRETSNGPKNELPKIKFFLWHRCFISYGKINLENKILSIIDLFFSLAHFFYIILDFHSITFYVFGPFLVFNKYRLHTALYLRVDAWLDCFKGRPFRQRRHETDSWASFNMNISIIICLFSWNIYESILSSRVYRSGRPGSDRNYRWCT